MSLEQGDFLPTGPGFQVLSFRYMWLTLFKPRTNGKRGDRDANGALRVKLRFGYFKVGLHKSVFIFQFVNEGFKVVMGEGKEGKIAVNGLVL